MILKAFNASFNIIDT